MPHPSLWLSSFLLMVIVFCPKVIAAPPILLDVNTSKMIGKHISYLQEHQSRLSLEQAIEQFTLGKGQVAFGDALSIGIGVDPVWLTATVDNPSAINEIYRLSVETPWLDKIETWFVHNGDVIRYVVGGDAMPFAQRPMAYKYYAFESPFPVGVTQIYIRIESVGPMALPVRISAVPAAISRDIASAYQYGVLYGILLALALYNFVLYTSIRQAEFGLYSLYLLGFVANSLSYTGQIHTVITPDWGPYFQDWTDIFLMITYSVLGLHFARLVLNTKRYAPRLNRATIWIASAIPIGMLIGALINELVFAMILAFILNSSFAVLFVILGYHAYKNHVPSARLFFVASVTAATCICVSTMSVAGLLPYNDFTFKAIEVGMTFEAILLALLLAQRFREAEKDKVIAENLARTDDITQLLNRHGFTHRAFDEWRACQFSKHDGSFLLIEVDKFTHLTQKYGTATSELILSTLAKQLSKRLDGTATLARWSSEIFIAFLPRTNQLQAMLIAEELRHLIANQSIPYGGEFLQVTASIGVAGSNLLYFNGVPHNQYDLHEMIASAKDALYQAKMAGRDQIFASHLAPKV